MKRIITGVFSALFLLSAVTVPAQKEKTKEKLVKTVTNIVNIRIFMQRI